MITDSPKSDFVNKPSKKSGLQNLISRFYHEKWFLGALMMLIPIE